MQFADHWPTRTGDGNWDTKLELAGSDFRDLDGYVDVWGLMVFAEHWHEGQLLDCKRFAGFDIIRVIH